ncbi:MerR family transcriptional regulator [Nocardiopsis alborubida]|uniref:MerR family transcriptional regulator n=1 Tax=Nocardiopsis alborubida TaxID=146802 RepID=A0A7X6M8M0_9ACTN|nr:MerR family transcriptional regulator [Nocardiopsis alborubida]NKY96657.1 MerR family transcriptional regulator [Nocardiopsis alborubida]
MVLMRVSELAERSGVPASTLRYYEERGLLPAQRSPAGYRLYDQRALERLAFITAAKQLGLDLDAIGELTAIWADHHCAQVKATLKPRITNRLAEADRKSAELEEFRTLLRNALRSLEQLPDRETPCDPSCSFLTMNPSAPIEPAPRAHLAIATVTEAPSCSLDGADYQQRIDRWHLMLQDAHKAPNSQGCTWSLPLSQAGPLAELAAAERQCCSFLRLHLDFTTQRVRLHVSMAPHRLPEPGSPAEQATRLLGAINDASVSTTKEQ